MEEKKRYGKLLCSKPVNFSLFFFCPHPYTREHSHLARHCRFITKMPWQQVSNLSKQIAESKTKDGNDPARQLIPAPPSPDDTGNQAKPESESESEDEAIDSYDPRACNTKQIYGGNPDHQDYRRTLRYFTNDAKIHVQPKTSIFDAPPRDSMHAKSTRSQPPGHFWGSEPPRLPTPDPLFVTDDWGNILSDHLHEIAEGMKDIAKDNNAALGGPPGRTIPSPGKLPPSLAGHSVVSSETSTLN